MGRISSSTFFFEKKEGYCIHYAATAVMMLRMYGIPARYVTGFLIPPSLFYLNDEGVWQADVPDDHAHAWAEAYIDGRWVRVETTPSGGFTADVQEAMGEEPETEKRDRDGNSRPKGPARRPEPNWQLKRRAAVKMQRPPEMKIRRKTAGQQGPLESLRPLAVFRKTSVLPGFSCLWFFCWQCF